MIALLTIDRIEKRDRQLKATANFGTRDLAFAPQLAATFTKRFLRNDGNYDFSRRFFHENIFPLKLNEMLIVHFIFAIIITSFIKLKRRREIDVTQLSIVDFVAKLLKGLQSLQKRRRFFTAILEQ